MSRPIVAGVVAGYYLDDWVGTSPLFLLVLTLGAFAGALYRMIRVLNRFR
jgi:F0F1-type ATP synthase assembly protein I